jgi:hypothetical protein
MRTLVIPENKIMLYINRLLILACFALALFQWFGVTSNIQHILQHNVQAAGVGTAYFPFGIRAVIAAFLLLAYPIVSGSKFQRIASWIALACVVGAVLVDFQMLLNGQLLVK